MSLSNQRHNSRVTDNLLQYFEDNTIRTEAISVDRVHFIGSNDEVFTVVVENDEGDHASIDLSRKQMINLCTTVFQNAIRKGEIN